MKRQYYVYIVSNPRKTVLYTGVTNNLVNRVWQHRKGEGGFTARSKPGLVGVRSS